MNAAPINVAVRRETLAAAGSVHLQRFERRHGLRSRTGTAARTIFVRLLPLRPNIRIVKSAYVEPGKVVYARKVDEDAAYGRTVEAAVPEAGFTTIATHDRRLIACAAAFAERHGIGSERFEFQLLPVICPVAESGSRWRREAVTAR